MTERKKDKDGHPVQIIDIRMNGNHPSRMDLDSNIKYILKDIGDTNVALISIAGPSRQGKSFLLSYMIKYLAALEKKTSSKWIKSSSSSKPLKGFPFQNGIERQTTGLWLWSRPFMIKNHKDEDIAVLVMDTQGVFDDHTTNREWSAIVGLSLLTSSCLIYNVVQNLQEDVLQILESFMQYGMLAMKDDESGDKCFQKLTFLIRDWNIPDDCEYGPLGGQEFLNQRLKVQDHQPEESKRVRQTLKKCFEELSCFLMPDPGEAAKSNDFTGSVGELDKRFVKCLSSFMESILGPDQIKVKKIGGQLMKGKNVLQLFQRYVDIFNSDEMPTTVTLLDATAHAVCETINSKCKDGFWSRFHEKLEISGFLNDSEFNATSEMLTKEFLIEFDKKKKFGDPKIARKHRRRLEGDLSKMKDKMKEINTKLKYDKSTNEQDAILNDFKTKISNLLDTNFILHDDLDLIFNQDKEKMLTIFCQRFDNNKAILGEIVPIFDSKIQEVTSQFHQQNDEKINKAKLQGQSIIDNCFAGFDTEINLRLLSTPNSALNNEMILAVDNILRKQALANFHANFKIGNEKLVNQFKNDLETLMNKKLEEIALNNATVINDQITRIEKLIENIINLYEGDISNALAQEMSPNETFLQNQHFQLQQKYSDYFFSQAGISDLNILTPHMQKLKIKLGESFQNSKTQLAELQSKLKDAAKQAIEQIRLDYHNDVEEIRKSSKIYSQQELNTFHQERVSRGEDNLQIPSFLSRQEKQQLRNLLIEELNQEFDTLNVIYQNKMDDANSSANDYISDAVLEYNTKMDDYIEKLTLETELQSQHQKLISTIHSKFSNEISHFPAGVSLQYKQNLEEELEQAFIFVQDKFATKRLEIEQQAEMFYNDALNKYNDEMEKQTISIQQEDLLSKWHELCKKQSITEFKMNVLSLKFDAHQMTAKLEREITNTFQGLLKRSGDTLKENIESVSGVVDESIDLYQREMHSLLEFDIDSDFQFQQQESQVRKRVVNFFQESSAGVPITIFTEKKEDLKIRLDMESQTFLDQFKRRKVELEECSRKSISNSTDEYTREMESLLQNNREINLPNLEKTHKMLKSRIIDNLDTRIAQSTSPTISKQLEVVYNGYKDRVKADIEMKGISKKLQEEIVREMNVVAVKSVNVEDLKSVENKLEKKLSEQFSSCDAPDANKKQELITELKERIASESKIAKELIEKKEPDDNAMRMAKESTLLTYEEEMVRHFGNSDFIHPRTLESYHRQASKIAMRKMESNKSIHMTPRAVGELTTLFEAAFTKHKDRNRMNTPVKPAIGIDLGTTFSCVAVYHAGKVTIIPNENSKNTTPSYVAFKDGTEMVGEPAKNQAHMNPKNTIFDAKRLIGRKFNDPIVQEDIRQWPFTVVDQKGVPKIEVDGKKYHPEEISAKVLKKMKEIAEKYLQCPVENAVITVPAYFNDGQKQATRDAGAVAGLKVLGILNEPTAAAVAYSLNYACKESRNVLIFDFGGGTFDVAILSIHSGKIVAKAVDGDTHLGGEDFDSNLVDYCIAEFKKATKIDLTADRTSDDIGARNSANRRIRRLRNECERQKINLSGAHVATVALDAIHGQLDLAVKITREVFQDINKTLLDKSITIVERALKSANLTKENINDIVLVGGSTRIPKVQELLSQFFNGKALNTTINPDEAVAYGAAIHAAILNGDQAEKLKMISLSDVAPLSIGIEILGGEMSTIISRNTTIPVKKIKEYVTSTDNQKSVLIEIYEGEEKVAIENHLLGKFELDGIPAGKAGSQKIEITMAIDKNGILNVNAVCKGSGVSKNLSIIQDKGRLTSEEIEKLQGKV